MGEPKSRVLALVVCGAGPAAAVSTMVKLAVGRGWTVQVIATPAALEFFDSAAIETQTGNPVRSQYRKPGEPRSSVADTIIVAPATYNTINKWAQGISDTYALGVLAETTGLGVPIVVLPFVNSALASRAPFQGSVTALRDEGVHILIGPGGIEPHPPHTGGGLIDGYPWHLALDEAERLADPGGLDRIAVVGVQLDDQPAVVADVAQGGQHAGEVELPLAQRQEGAGRGGPGPLDGRAGSGPGTGG